MKKSIYLLILLLIVFSSTIQIFAYTITDEYVDYILNIDLSYKDLNLTSEELEAIEYLQENGGITYGLYKNEEPVKMVFEQISKIFEVEVKPINYQNFNQLLDDVLAGEIDFTSNILPTEERMEIYDYTYSTIKEKVFMFAKKDEYIKYYIDPALLNKKQVIVYPEGFVLNDLIEKAIGDKFDIQLIPAETSQEAINLVRSGKADMIVCTITWFDEVYKINDYVGVDYTDMFNMYLSGSITKKDSHKEFVSAINKLYVETEVVSELQQQVDNYYKYKLLSSIDNNHKQIFDFNKTYKILASEYSPYIYEENGEIKGLLVELIGRIFNYYDVNYEIILFEKKVDLYLASEALKEGIDMVIPVLDTEKSMETYNLTLPIVESDIVIIAKDKNNSTHFSKVEDFAIKRVGAINSHFMKEYIDEALYSDEYITYYENMEKVIEAIEKGEVNFGLVPYESFSKYAIKNNIIDIGVMENIDTPKYRLSIGMQKTDEGEDLALLFSYMIDTLGYRDLEKKYLSNKSEIEIIYENRASTLSLLAKTIFMSSVTIIILLVFITINNNKRANTDYLTKLRNRRTFKDYVKNVKNKNGMSMAYIDLDNFKIINDLYGHHYGDFVLSYIGSKLKQIGNHSKAFRIGGDEFVLIYNHNYVDFEEVKKIFRTNIKIENNDIKIEGSIGNINLTKYRNYEVEEIINLVDYAMLRAKRKGKNTFVEISDDLVNDFFTINQIRASLEKGIDEEKIEIFIELIKLKDQVTGVKLLPKYSFKDKLINYEELKLYLSNKLLINNIDYLMFERLCKTKKELNELNYDTSKMHSTHTVLINKIDDDYINKLIEIMNKYNINSEEINLNINTNMFSINEGQKYLYLLNKLNCSISINLFDVEGNSLIYFKYFNIKTIEIDVEELIAFFEGFEHIDNEFNIKKAFEENVLVKILYNVCSNYNVNILLHISNTEKEKSIIKLIEENVETKIFYCEKNYSKSLDESLNEYIHKE